MSAFGRLRSFTAGRFEVRDATVLVRAESAAGGASHRGSLPGGCAPAAAIPSGLRACRNPPHGSACSVLWRGPPAAPWLPPGHPEDSSAPQRVQTREPRRQSRAIGESSRYPLLRRLSAALVQFNHVAIRIAHEDS